MRRLNCGHLIDIVNGRAGEPVAPAPTLAAAATGPRPTRNGSRMRRVGAHRDGCPPLLAPREPAEGS